MKETVHNLSVNLYLYTGTQNHFTRNVQILDSSNSTFIKEFKIKKCNYIFKLF